VVRELKGVDEMGFWVACRSWVGFIIIIIRKLVLTFCINSTRGGGGHEPRRWIRALVKVADKPLVLTFCINSTVTILFIGIRCVLINARSR